MATLYDLELQESNNFIHALMKNGVTPAVTLLEDQRRMADSMGDAGKEMAAEIDNPNSDIGKSFQRLKALQNSIAEAMKAVKLTPELAEKAQEIFNRNPESLSTLTEEEKTIINAYWLKKKSCIVILLQKGFTHEELFS